MPKASLDDLAVFVAVGREGNFTRAAAKLGVSPSAVSQTIRGLEERLNVRLLTRTTRSVSLTEVGIKLLGSIDPMLEEINMQLASLGDITGKPTGHIRITADELAIRTRLWPALRPVLLEHPDITVEIISDYGLTDIVAERFDAGVRAGGIIAKDMIAVPIGPPMRMVTVCSPQYLAARTPPETPQELTMHRCINFRLPTSGGLPAWEFNRADRRLRVRVDAQAVFNSLHAIREAAIEDLGIAHLPDVLVQSSLDQGRLIEVLTEWSRPFPGYHLYYPSRRLVSSAFRLVIEALRFRG